jgi:hypothetical protein
MATENRGPYTGGWYDERNKRRKKRYRTDPEYRAAANQQARNGYRKAAGVNKPFDPRNNAHMLEPGENCAGTMRELMSRPGKPKVLTFTKEELARIFQRPEKQVRQWAADGRIPAAMVKGRNPGHERQWVDVYTALEAKAIVNTLGWFLADLHYFRRDHAEAIDATRAAVADARKRSSIL